MHPPPPPQWKILGTGLFCELTELFFHCEEKVLGRIVNGEFSKVSGFTIIKITKLFDKEVVRETTSNAEFFCW